MANFVYNEAKRAFARGEIDMASDDIRVLLVMSNTTADTEDDVNTISAITTLDEYDGSGYPTVFADRKALTGEAVNEDAANNRAEFDANDVTFASLGVGTRQCTALVVYKHVTSDADSVPLAYIDQPSGAGGFPFDGNGGDVVISWGSEGILHFS